MQQAYKTPRKKRVPQPFPIGYKGQYRGQYLPPRGLLKGTLEQLKEAGCIQTVDEKVFKGLMKATVSNPCNGCPVWAEGGPKCGAFQSYHTSWARHQEALKAKLVADKAAVTPHNAPEGHVFADMNMKQIAETLGVSLSEARRRKAAGTLLQGASA